MGIEEAFTTLIKENEKLIYKIARLYTNNTQDQDDLFQEIVIQIWKAFKKFKNHSKISTWVYRIAMNTAITGLRKRKKYISVIPINRTALNYSEIQSDEQKDKLEFLYQCIKELNELDKGIILLYLEHKSYNEIADAIGLSETNVGTRMSRIKQKIRSKVIKC
jgi:RNA polymerase sigma-70 factor (ECF subfamily)